MAPSLPMRRALLLLLSSAFLPIQAQEPLPASPADAPSTVIPLRLALVDIERVFERHPSTVKATSALTESRAKLTAEYKDLSNALKKTLQSHQELIRAGKKTEAVELLKQVNEQEKAIATLKTTQNRNLQEQFRSAKQDILTDIQKAIAEMNADGTYDLILDRSPASSIHGLPTILHAPGVKDLTDEVIAELKKKSQP